MSSKSTYYINSLPVEPNKYGSKNDTPIKAIGVFQFDLEGLIESELISFSFPNYIDNRTEEVIVPYYELIERIIRNHSYSPNLLVLWLMPDDTVYNATNLGIEGEWFFIAVGMGEGTPMDFTQYLKPPI
ncbi:MAG TPA: hypothetical protein DHV28_08530 [Ignavibacteriales bacterium]|nr:hypothetical protein [Ignavibacteriales bacterium]